MLIQDTSAPISMMNDKPEKPLNEYTTISLVELLN